MEITAAANITVVFQNLAIAGGDATGGGVLGGKVALGGGLLIDGGTVSMSDVAVRDDRAEGAAGTAGAAGGNGHVPGRRRRRSSRPAAGASTWRGAR